MFYIVFELKVLFIDQVHPSNIIVFAINSPPEHIIKSVSKAKKIIIIDCFSDSAGWNSSNEKTIKSIPGTNIQILPCSNLSILSNLDERFKKAIEILKIQKDERKGNKIKRKSFIFFIYLFFSQFLL